MNAHRVRFVFNKHRGKSAVIRTWEEIGPAQQCLILEGVQLDPDEVPVIGSAEGQMRMMITTKRIVWRAHETVHDVDLDAIARVKVPEFFESNKQDLHELWLVTRDGAEFQLDAEPGEPAFVLWNLLLGILPPAKARPVVGQ
jgi:hypothetical protein